MARPRLSPKARTLIKRIRAELKAYGVRLRVYKSHVIRADGDECSGYFDPAKKVIGVGSRASEADFMVILLHEYVHFQQWAHHHSGRRSRLARAWKASMGHHPMGTKGLSKAERYTAYRALLELERQAEVGAQRYMDAFGFGDEKERLIIRKAAALYLYSHRLMFEKQRWFREGNGDLYKWLEDVNIWNATPTTLRGVDFNRIPPKLKKLLLRLF
jgi:hypothetical protein